MRPTIYIAVVAASMLATAVTPLTAVGGPEPVEKDIVLTASSAFEGGLGSTTVQHDFQTGGMVLNDSCLIEDDGAGAGGTVPWVTASERSPTVEVDESVWVKKILEVERPIAREAILYVRPGRAELFFDGVKIETGRPAQKFFRVPTDLVKQGRNEVEIRGTRQASVRIKVAARKDILENDPAATNRPPRSFESTDGGKTWTPIDGELTVRLHLTQYLARGRFTSPVLDLAAEKNDPLGLDAIAVQSVDLSDLAQTPPGTGVSFAIRFGSTPVYDPKHWGEWQPAPLTTPVRERFVQWHATLSSDDPKATPVLQKVTLRAKLLRAESPAWAEGIAVQDFHNAEICQTSMPFEYADPNQPRLKALRLKWRLDDVVRSGKTEMEKLVLLRHWVAHHWHYHPPEGHYPAWDADEILTRGEGMCVQYAITYIQCCTALGYPARYVGGYHPGTARTAHEVTEVWSNEYGQWVVMDPTEGGDEFYADPRTGRPLDMLQVHDRMVRHDYGDRPATFENRPRHPSLAGDIVEVRGLATTLPARRPSSRQPLTKWPVWTKWLYLNYVPRNNFYAQPTPLPRLEGWNDWDWTGFWSWYDAQTPRDWRYCFFTSRRSDLEWTINEVRFSAAYGQKPLTLAMTLGTVTPNFDSYLMSENGHNWKPVGSQFVWGLHPGANRLELRVRNSSGIVGPISFLTVNCSSRS